MGKLLSQSEIDSIVDALNTLRNYADDNAISADLLHNQVILTQGEIDKLISTLNTVKDVPLLKPNVNVALTQPEIDSLIDALNSIKEYETIDALEGDIANNQAVLSQNEIDTLIEKLLQLKGNS
ncbi:MAG: hypothetical protein IKR35_00465 [Lachnospiraceae bacterium]|nr:hypothetical protein [Lachnospiraceae bacterium]